MASFPDHHQAQRSGRICPDLLQLAVRLQVLGEQVFGLLFRQPAGEQCPYILFREGLFIDEVGLVTVLQLVESLALGAGSLLGRHRPLQLEQVEHALDAAFTARAVRQDQDLIAVEVEVVFRQVPGIGGQYVADGELVVDPLAVGAVDGVQAGIIKIRDVIPVILLGEAVVKDAAGEETALISPQLLRQSGTLLAAEIFPPVLKEGLCGIGGEAGCFQFSGNKIADQVFHGGSRTGSDCITGDILPVIWGGREASCQIFESGI